MVAVHDVLRGDTLLAGFKGDGHTMLVAAANHKHLFTVHTHIACVDVSGNIHSREVSDMHRSVGVRQSCCDKRSFEFVHDQMIVNLCCCIERIVSFKLQR